MASNASLLNYVGESFESLVDTINSLQEELSQAQDTIDQQAGLIIELQEGVGNG